MKSILVLALTLFFGSSALAKRKIIHFVTIEAPPFMSESLPDQGAGIFALKEIFKKMDYDLQVTFAPLPRSKAMALAKNEISGFLPSTEDDIESGFALSKIVFETPWVIVERKNHPIHWKTGKDLAKFKGGNVIGYSVRPDLKKIFDKEKITLETAPDDAHNLLKLANKRIDYVFIDASVFRYLVASDENLKKYADQLQINPKSVKTLGYGIAFKTDPQNQALMQEFNNKVNPAELTGYIETYLKNLNH